MFLLDGPYLAFVTLGLMTVIPRWIASVIPSQYRGQYVLEKIREKELFRTVYGESASAIGVGFPILYWLFLLNA